MREELHNWFGFCLLLKLQIHTRRINASCPAHYPNLVTKHALVVAICVWSFKSGDLSYVKLEISSSKSITDYSEFITFKPFEPIKLFDNHMPFSHSKHIHAFWNLYLPIKTYAQIQPKRYLLQVPILKSHFKSIELTIRSTMRLFVMWEKSMLICYYSTD